MNENKSMIDLWIDYFFGSKTRKSETDRVNIKNFNEFSVGNFIVNPSVSRMVNFEIPFL